MQNARQAEMISIGNTFLASVRAAKRARRKGKKVVFLVHMPRQTEKRLRTSSPGKSIVRIWEKHCYEQGDVLITETQEEKRILEKCGIRKPVYVVPKERDWVLIRKILRQIYVLENLEESKDEENKFRVPAGTFRAR
ncbi:MAG: glycosyltransferase [Eubacteriales bacterium]|nr:glycosyltransferase [Eubacteriales bacterium]